VDLKESATEFVKIVTTHFALLFVHGRRPSIAQLNELPATIFLDALIMTLQFDNRDRAKTAGEVLDMMLGVFDVAYGGDKVAIAALPLWNDLADRLRALCSWYFLVPILWCDYIAESLLSREWYNKAGGVMGITFLIQRLDVNWVRRQQVAFMGALLYLIRDLSPSISVATSDEAVHTLIALVKCCQVKGASPFSLFH